MWCGVKFTMGHRCMKSQLYQLLVEDGDEQIFETAEALNSGVDIQEVVEEESSTNIPHVISLNALSGMGDAQTMRIRGRIKQ